MTGKQEGVEASTKVNRADALISTDAVQGKGSSSGSDRMGIALMTLLAATAKMHALDSAQQMSKEIHQNQQTIEERAKKLSIKQMTVHDFGVERRSKEAVATEADKVASMSPNACEGPNAEEQRSAIRKDFDLFDTSHDGNLNLPEIKVMPQIVNNF